MTKEEFIEHKAALFQERMIVNNSAQHEYAHSSENAFNNFTRVGDIVKCVCENCGKPTRIGFKATWAVYFLKHVDGILSYISGVTSQREDVRGRITDVANYADLLDGMIVDERREAGPTHKDVIGFVAGHDLKAGDFVTEKDGKLYRYGFTGS